jgi:hypothetical protein
MGLPKISINFTSAAISAIQRSERGIVALIIKDDGVTTGAYTLLGTADKPVGFSASNAEQIDLAFLGGANAPQKVIVYVLAAAATNYDVAFNYFETVKFDYMAIPAYDKTTQQTAVVAWIKKIRDNLGRKSKIVLPLTAGDYEGIINFTSTGIKVGEKTYTPVSYSTRIAGLLAGTPLTISATYQTLPEVTDVERVTFDALNTRIDAGEFVIFHDGEKVKVGRAVNSLTTTSQAKPADWKKIKIVDILDLIYTDIKATAEDSYIGKFANSYDNKVLLINAIKGYLLQLELEGLLDVGKNDVSIDIVAQRVYLQSVGVDVEKLTEQQIKEANTNDKVFLGGAVQPLDAIEDITLGLTI